MIEYLERLLEEGKDEEALRLAEDLAKSPEHGPVDWMAIQAALLRARLRVGNPRDAISPGDTARRLAIDLQQWDYHGTICLFLAIANGMIQRYSQAVDLLKEHIEYRDHYDQAKQYSVSVWYHLGILYRTTGRGPLASEAFLAALREAELEGNDRRTHGVRQAVAEQFIKLNQIAPIPHLLVQCSHYLRNNPFGAEHRTSRMFYLELRVEYALKVFRTERAINMALKGLEEAGQKPGHLAAFHMLLAQQAKEDGRIREALGHAVSAQIYSRMGGLVQLHSDVSDFIAEMVSCHPSATDDLDLFCSVPAS